MLVFKRCKIKLQKYTKQKLKSVCHQQSEFECRENIKMSNESQIEWDYGHVRLAKLSALM